MYIAANPSNNKFHNFTAVVPAALLCRCYDEQSNQPLSHILPAYGR